MAKTNIEWCDFTFNPWRGCHKVSAGCANCYAETMSGRNPATLGIWGVNGTRVLASESMWKEPVKWNQQAQAEGVRYRVFCASLADVFEDYSGNFPDTADGAHGGVRCLVDSKGNRLCTRSGSEIAPQWPDESGWRPYTMNDARRRLFELIEATPNLDWLLLTKRPENIMDMVPEHWEEAFPPNVWMGTSAENQEAADKRLPYLRKVPAQIRFISGEPLLGAVTLNLKGIDWVIVGGESGPSSRPMHPEWARSLRDQCQVANVAFLFKQWGEWSCPHPMSPLEKEKGEAMFKTNSFIRLDENYAQLKIGKKISGRVLDGRTWDEFPKVNHAIR